MYSRSPRKVNSFAMLCIISLLMLLIGCGTDGTSNPTQTSRGIMPLPNEGVLAMNIDGLHIQSLTGIECPAGSATLRIPPNQLVLATTSRITYDNGQLQQMRMYLKAFYQTDETLHAINGINILLPSTLLWVAGVVNDRKSASEFGSGSNCTADLEITNVSSTTIQIPQASVRLTQSPQQNTYQYHLIDTCTLLSLDECECHVCGGAPSSCGTYYANINLGMGKEGSVFAATLTADEFNDQLSSYGCSELTLQPGQSGELIMEFYPLPSPSHLVYFVVPELTLVTSSGQQVLALPQLRSSIAFADESQFSCYGLQSHTFVPEKREQSNQRCI